MKTPLTIMLSSAIFGASLAATYALLSPAPAQATAPSTSGALSSVTEPQGRLAAGSSRADLDALTERVARLEATPPPSVRFDPAAIEALVRQVLAEGQASAAGPALALEAARPRSTEELVGDVLAATDLEREGLWKVLAAEGRADEVLAALRERADADPNDPEKQVELGEAYIARIAEVGNSPKAGSYAMQADAAFDRALEADPEHLSARMHKAVALSFWPPVFGKQAAAIQQFEILVSKQAARTSSPKFAETHLLLGNLYEQTGQRDKALLAWERGAALFPDHAGLAQQLALAQAQR
ncbi:MAG: tetratricopeptide repeat protein [Planctomycetota bacterium]